jgi:opacity protein-like surface antigen
MKNSLFRIALLALLYPFLLGAPLQEKTEGVREAQVIVNKAKIYLEATPFSSVIDTVQQGTVVALFPSGKKDQKWLYVSYYSIKRNAQVTGFVKANNVEIFPEEPEIQNKEAEESMKLQNDQGDLASAVSDPLLAGEKEALSKEVEKPEETKIEEQVNNGLETEITQEREKQEQEKMESTEPENGKTSKTEEAERNTERGQADQASPGKKESDLEKKQEPQKNVSEKKEEDEISVQKFTANEREQKERTAREGEKTASGAEEKEAQENCLPEEAVKSPVETADKQEAMGDNKSGMPQVLTKVSIKARMANIRLMPSLKSTVINQVPSGVELETLAKTGNWYRVNLPPNEDGFVLSGYVHHSIVEEIYESVQPAVEPEKPEEEPKAKEEEPEVVPEPEKQLEPPVKREKKGLPLWIGGGAGFTMPVESRMQKGLSFGGTLGVEIMKFLALELRIPYFQSNVVESFDGLSSGRLRNFNFMLSMQVRYPLNDALVPYLVGGGDYHWNSFSLNDTVEKYWNDMGFTIEENVDHSFGFHAGAGLDFFLLNNVALNVDIRYYTANLEGTRIISDQASLQEVSGPVETMKLNSIQAGISVKFFLGR